MLARSRCVPLARDGPSAKWDGFRAIVSTKEGCGFGVAWRRSFRIERTV
jgi:hypothetical protein